MKNNFQIKHTKEVPTILKELGGSVAITTYQANRLIFLSSTDGKTISQTPKLMKRPMGLSFVDGIMAVATAESIEMFKQNDELAKNFPNNPGKYSTLISPRASFYTGKIDLHDVHIGTKGIYGVNTRFSTLCKFDYQNSFSPIWKPEFITKFLPDDRCHLNGLAMDNGKPKYISCLGDQDKPNGWRDTIENGGLIIDVETNKTLIDKLPMPHSPRIIGNNLYVLLSAIGGLLCVDLKTGDQKAFGLGNFVRGLAHHGDYLIIGTSKIRESSKLFNKLPVKKEQNEAGIIFFNIKTEKVEGKIIYEDTVDEIYDVAFLPGLNNLYMLTKEDEIHSSAIDYKSTGFWIKPKDEK